MSIARRQDIRIQRVAPGGYGANHTPVQAKAGFKFWLDLFRGSSII